MKKTVPRHPTFGFRGLFALFAWILGLAVLALIAYPTLTVVIDIFFANGSLSLAPFRDIARVRGIGTIVQNTAIFSLGSLVFATFLGATMAWINERTDARVESLAGILPIVPLMIPTLGSALGYVLLFTPHSGIGNIVLRQIFGLQGSSGPVDILNMAGMIYITSLHLAPLAYLVIAAALRNIDPALDEASRISGATPFTTMRRVTLPIILPALAGAALIVGINAVGSFIVPLIIGTGAGITTLPVHVYRLFSSYPVDEGQAMALGLCLLAVVYVAVLLQMRVTASLRRATISGRHSSHTSVRLGAWLWPIRAIMIVYLVAIFIPLLGLIIGSLQPFLGAGPQLFTLDSFRVVLSNLETRSALLNSLFLAALTATACIGVAAMLIYASKHILKRGGRLFELTMITPSMIPPVVLAVSFIGAFSGAPFYLSGTLTLVFLAFFTLYLPEASRAVSAALSQSNDELSEASHVAGAGLVKTLRRVVFPQVAMGLLAGWVIVFFFAVNEVTAAAFLGGLNAPVVGQVLIDYFQNGRLSQVAAMTLIITSATMLVVVFARTALSRAYRFAPRKH